MRRTLLPLPVLAALPACAGAPAANADRSCFWASQASGFRPDGQDRALVRTGSRQWELTLAPGCPDIDWALAIGIGGRGGDRICPGRPAELILPEASGSGARRCLVRAIRPLPDREPSLSDSGPSSP